MPYVRCQHAAPNVWELWHSQILHQNLRFVNFPVQKWQPHQGPRGTCKYLPRGDSCPWSKRIKRPMGPRLPWKLAEDDKRTGAENDGNSRDNVRQWLVVELTHLKNIGQIGSFPQGEHKKYLKPPPRRVFEKICHELVLKTIERT